MKKLANLADILDQIRNYSAADKVDQILKQASGIKPISGNTSFQMPKKEEGKREKEKGKAGPKFQDLLDQMSEKVSDKEKEENYSSQSKEERVTMQDLVDLMNKS